MSHWPTYYHKKWRRSLVLSPRFFLPKRSKNFHSNLALETRGFKPRHNTLYCMPITDQYNSPRIYCLFYTLVWQVLIRTELIFPKILYTEATPGRCSVEKVFFSARSPCCRHLLTYPGWKGYSHRRLFFPGSFYQRYRHVHSFKKLDVQVQEINSGQVHFPRYSFIEQ